MLKKNRHSQIIEIMEKKNVISIKELAEKTGCTEMTIRRNLDELEAMHFVVRHRGYATLLDSARPTDYYEQKVERADEKSAIAHVALSYIHEGSSICIDSGMRQIKPCYLFCKNCIKSVFRCNSLRGSVLLSFFDNYLDLLFQISGTGLR